MTEEADIFLNTSLLLYVCIFEDAVFCFYWNLVGNFAGFYAEINICRNTVFSNNAILLL